MKDRKDEEGGKKGHCEVNASDRLEGGLCVFLTPPIAFDKDLLKARDNNRCVRIELFRLNEFTFCFDVGVFLRAKGREGERKEGVVSRTNSSSTSSSSPCLYF